MNKKLQDLAWQCLPLEAKREVKQAFRLPTENDYEQGYDNALASLFGHHNLTSDAEGKNEFLTVSRSKVTEVWQRAKAQEAAYSKAEQIDWLREHGDFDLTDYELEQVDEIYNLKL